MTAIEALSQLDALTGEDQEGGHIDADEILLSFLKDHDQTCKDVAAAYERARDRVVFWYA
ncbi:MAG: hypothetical protein WB992_04800 [Bryobacteraceae bacterium]